MPRLIAREPPRKRFPLGGPVPAEDLVGRERYIVASVERLLDGQNLLVAGPRRIGKTSVMLEVLRRLRRKGAYVAYVDCLGATSPRGLAERLVDALLENTTGAKGAYAEARALAGGAKPARQTRYEQLEPAIAIAREPTEQRMFEAALDLPQTLAAKAKRRVVVAFDEFQAAGRLGPRIFDVMRTRLQQQKNVAYAFLGSEAGILESLFTTKSEPFYRFAVAHDLADPAGHRFGIDPEDWQSYIRKKFADRRLTIGEAQIDQLLDLTGGHPQDTMQVASELYYFMRDAQLRAATAQLTALAYAQALAELERPFALVWGELGAHKYQQAVAKRIASKETLFRASGDVPRIEVLRAVESMRARGLVLRLGRGRYEFVEPMFGEYVRQLDA